LVIERLRQQRQVEARQFADNSHNIAKVHIRNIS
jgi:hypothetical protein